VSLKVSSSMHDPEFKKKATQPEKPEKKTGTLLVEKSKENRESFSASVQGNSPHEETAEKTADISKPWLQRILWGAAAVMVLILVFLTMQFFGVIPAKKPVTAETAPTTNVQTLPDYVSIKQSLQLMRLVNPKTTIPERANEYVTTYTVQTGDSIFGIARDYKVKPESVLWANMKTLQGDPQMISVGLNLNIPPVDGVYYQWKDGDTLDAIAGKFKVDPQAIILWPGNKLDLTNPVIVPGQFVMIPGGKDEFKEWVIPIPFKEKSGTSSISDQCSITPGMYWGTGLFIWPTVSGFISGNDYWDGHRGIDIGSNEGDSVWAADSGVVVYAGQKSGGYGIVVIIEHDTTYHTFHTVYAHLNSTAVSCGQIVNQGQVIGYSGNTGNSTGPHLHFEIREDGGFVNPHFLLGM
jgi:LysM repeat protein